ncbi:uncharacterized protein PRD47_004662 [Ara ararauna]
MARSPARAPPGSGESVVSGEPRERRSRRSPFVSSAPSSELPSIQRRDPRREITSRRSGGGTSPPPDAQPVPDSPPPGTRRQTAKVVSLSSKGKPADAPLPRPRCLPVMLPIEAGMAGGSASFPVEHVTVGICCRSVKWGISELDWTILMTRVAYRTVVMHKDYLAKFVSSIGHSNLLWCLEASQPQLSFIPRS